MAFGCKFSDSWSVLPTVVAYGTPLPSRKFCNSMERAVMGDMYRYRNDETFFNPLKFFVIECFFMRGGGFIPKSLRGRGCNHCTDSLALVML